MALRGSASWGSAFSESSNAMPSNAKQCRAQLLDQPLEIEVDDCAGEHEQRAGEDADPEPIEVIDHAAARDERADRRDQRKENGNKNACLIDFGITHAKEIVAHLVRFTEGELRSCGEDDNPSDSALLNLRP